jgi:YD repeat-containing protein
VSDAEYAADGRLLVWRDNLLTSKVERDYSYDATGKLISVTSSGADVTDEFHYDEQGKKTRVRTLPPRSVDRGAWLSDPFVFENAEQGDCLTAGGSVTTRYNDEDQPIESLIREAHGELLGKIVHNDTNGRLISETLVWVKLELFQELQGLPEQELRLAKAQMKQAMSEAGLDNVEGSYVYDDKGRVTYNEHRDEVRTVRIERCIDRIIPKLAHLDRLSLRGSLPLRM